VSGKGSVVGLVYAGVCYLVGNAGLGYCALFLLGIAVPTSIDDPPSLPVPAAVAVDLGLVALWAVQHSVMARPRFKRALTRLIPKHTERATYCLASGLALGLVCVLWQPIPGTIWSVAAQPWAAAATVVSLAGWGIMVAATFEIGHAELLGLAQAYRAQRGLPAPSSALRERFLYRVVRHPIQLGILIAIWAAPVMSASHLLFSGSMTVYILVGLHFEERGLLRELGPVYADYCRRVPKLLPFTRFRPPPRP
jgi:protein-S-isoprenylcysteine O-methyltransferase Ste14